MVAIAGTSPGGDSGFGRASILAAGRRVYCFSGYSSAALWTALIGVGVTLARAADPAPDARAIDPEPLGDVHSASKFRSVMRPGGDLSRPAAYPCHGRQGAPPIFATALPVDLLH